MDHIPAMADLAFTDDEKAEKAKDYGCPGGDGEAPLYHGPDYPYGASFSLTERELKIGGLDGEDIGVGDMLHIHMLVKVTSVSAQDGGDKGSKQRVELQITHISTEDEDQENRDESARDKGSMLDKLYGA